MEKMSRLLSVCICIMITSYFQVSLEAKGRTKDSAVEDLAESTRILTGKIEELERKITLMEDAQRKKIEAEAIQKETAVIEDKKPEEVIKMAKDMIDENRNTEARRLLEAFASKNPKSIYRGMALFYIGKSYFRDKDYQNAAIKYMESVEANPKGSKTGKALYLLSLCFRYLSERAKCRAILEKIIKDYPGPFAVKAANDLKKLKNAG